MAARQRRSLERESGGALMSPSDEVIMTQATFMLRQLIVTLGCAVVFGQQPANNNQAPRPYPIKPDVENARYGPHERNLLDFWKAHSERPAPLILHIHGGGFVAGDKTTIPVVLLHYALAHGISVATMNYRYSTQAPYPAPMEDGASAVRFLRGKAKEWNLDPNRFAATGGSAGAGILMWVGFKAAAENDESSRLQVLGPVDGQSTYDPREIARLVGEETSKIGPLFRLVGLKPGEQPDARIWRLYEQASPINHVTRAAPPVFMYYSRPMKPLPVADTGEGIHNPRMGYLLKERMDQLGVECEVHLVDEYKSRPPAADMYPQMIEFFMRHFKEK
jgi:acetyl esterase